MGGRRAKIIWRVLGSVSAVAALAGVIQFWIVKAALSSEIARAKAEGIPTSFSEFNHRPGLTTVENAAPDYEAAIAAFRPLTAPIYAPTSPAEDAKRRKFDHVNYLKNRPAVLLLFKATAKPHCNFSYDFPNDLYRLYTDQAKLRALTKLVASEALFEAETGHPIAGLNLLAHVAGVGPHEAETPIADAMLGGLAVVSIVCRGVQVILDRHGREAGVAEAASSSIRTRLLHADLEAILEYENLELLTPLASGADLRAGLSATHSGSGPLRAASYSPTIIEQWREVQWRTIRSQVKAVRSFGGDWVKLDGDFNSSYESGCRGIAGMYLRENGADPEQEASFLLRGIAERRVTLQAAAALILWKKTGMIPNRLPLDGEDGLDARKQTTPLLPNHNRLQDLRGRRSGSGSRRTQKPRRGFRVSRPHVMEVGDHLRTYEAVSSTATA